MEDYIIQTVLCNHFTDFQGITVLDAGCGDGKYSIMLAKLGAKVISIDRSKDCIDTLKTKATEQDLDITPIQANVCSYSIPPLVNAGDIPLKFDLVLFTNVLHFIPPHRQLDAVFNTYSHLSRNGLLVFSDLEDQKKVQKPILDIYRTLLKNPKEQTITVHDQPHEGMEYPHDHTIHFISGTRALKVD